MKQQYKNDSPPESATIKKTMCDNCDYRPVSTNLSCKIYDSWCAFCNLTLLSTKDSD